MYAELGETVMTWLAALTTKYEHGVARVNHKTLVMLGVPVDGVMDVYTDHTSVRLVFEKAAQVTADGYVTPRVEDAMKADWLRMEPTRSTNKVYLWYRRTQEKALAYGIPLMPFRAIVLRHGAHGLCIPGFGLDTYDTCGKLLLDVLRMCMSDDALELATNIRESQMCYTNGFDFLWYVLKMVVQMMDSHISPHQPAYNGDLAQHAGKWDVYQMMMTHRGVNFTKEVASIAFLTDIVCSRFAPVAKVELGILRNAVPESVAWGEPWVMPAQYHVRKLAQRVFQNSPALATSDGDLGKMSRPTFRRLEYDTD